MVVLGGLGVLLAGLWWVQMVSARDYQANLETQSFRTVRIPAVRGKILDRNGVALAENRPTYNVSLYLEELRKPFDAVYAEKAARARQRADADSRTSWSRQLNRKLTKEERKQFVLTLKDEEPAAAGRRATRSPATWSRRSASGCGSRSRSNPTNFERHYETRLALPCPVLTDLNPAQIALLRGAVHQPDGR